MVKLVLFMIVKNESAIIKTCIDHVLPYIDAISICDTGSIDNTVDIINSYRDKLSVNCVEDKFVNFGRNRTASFNIAKDFCTSLGWDLSTTYGLTIDADMQFPLISKLDKNMLTDCGYSCVQDNNSIVYSNTRFFRMDCAWKCVGVTHEYWSFGSSIAKLPSDVVISDIGNGGCKEDKFERDIRLLEQGLVDEPANRIRYYFYLAQSYKDCGQFEKAIKNYSLRIAAGGWDEEVFYAHYMIGNCYRASGKKYEATCWYWLAYNFRRTRREPLIALATMLREDRKYIEAYSVAKLAQSIPFPISDILFVGKHEYTYLAEREISIVGYYLPNNVQDGHSCCEYVLRYADVYEPDRENAAKNLLYYINKLECKKVHIFKEACYSTSLQFDTNKSYVLTTTPHHHMNLHIRNDDNGELSDTREILHKNSGIPAEYVLFMWMGELWASYIDDSNNLKAFHIDVRNIGDIPVTVTQLFKCDEKIKMCLPLSCEHPDLTIICYYLGVLATIHVNKVYMFVSPEIKVFDPKGTLINRLRGSTPPIYYKGKMIGVVHEIFNKNVYMHKFIIYSTDLVPEKMSQSFYVDSHGIERITSLHYHAQRNVFIMHFTKNNTASVLEVAEQLVDSLIVL